MPSRLDPTPGALRRVRTRIHAVQAREREEGNYSDHEENNHASMVPREVYYDKSML